MRRFVLRHKGAVVCVLAYLLAFLCSMAAETIFIFQSYRDIITAVAEDDKTYYMENGRFSPSAMRNSANNFVYDAAGNRIDCISAYSAGEYVVFDRCAAQLMEEMGGRELLYTLKVFPRLNIEGMIVVALPMEDGGLFLFAKELSTVGQGLALLTLPVLLINLAAVCCLGIVIRKKQAVEQLQREYIDNISHELKTPIAAVKALAEPIHDGLVQDPDSLRRYAGIMLNELSNLERTVSDMLELSRIQNKQMDASKSAVSAENALGAVVGKYAVLCHDFGLSFTLSPPLQEWPVLYTNGKLAARLLDILLDNAVKFTEAQGNISITVTEEPQHITVAVNNDGVRIDPADQSHIFERFYQGNKSHSKKGSGLGLAIAKEISVSLNEKLWLSGSSAKGTQFCFTIGKR